MCFKSAQRVLKMCVCVCVCVCVYDVTFSRCHSRRYGSSQFKSVSHSCQT